MPATKRRDANTQNCSKETEAESLNTSSPGYSCLTGKQVGMEASAVALAIYALVNLHFVLF